MASKGDIIPLSESTAGEDSHMGEVIAFDHIHLISRDPKAVADWYKEMFGRKPQGQAYGNHGNHRVRPILYRCHGIMFCPPNGGTGRIAGSVRSRSSNACSVIIVASNAGTT